MSGREQVVDLSNPIDESIPVFPEFESVSLESTGWAARDGATMERVDMATHTGTHVDAPCHFIPGGKALDDFPVGKFMGEGVVLDLTPKEPDDAITVADLEPFADRVEPGDVVMLHTGWDEYYGRTTEYLFEYPYLTGDAARYLADLGPKAVGVDTMSVAGWTGEVPAHGPTTDVSPADSHVPLLEAEVIPIEELRDLDAVLDGQQSARAYFHYAPVSYLGTSGATVRAYARL